MLFTRRDFGLLVGGAVFATTLPVHAQSISGKLVLYTSQPDRDAQATVAAFRKVHPNVEVEIFRSGTTEVMSKLAAEFAAGQPRPDVLLIADAASMETLKKAGRLEAFKEARIGGARPEAIDADRTYFGTKMITSGIVYNKGAKLQPKSWADLAKPEMKGQISMPSPLYSGAAAISLGAWTARQDLGWKFIEALKANEAIAVRGNGAVLKAVATGEKSYGVLVDFMAFNEQKKGAPIEFVFPTEGVTMVTEPAAILKTAQNKAAARAFVDFLLSDEGQKLALSQGYLPANPTVGNPAWLPAGTRINIMPMNIAGMVETNADNLKRFADMFGK
jgi:iron(III) transport system substrate-binding protein